MRSVSYIRSYTAIYICCFISTIKFIHYALIHGIFSLSSIVCDLSVIIVAVYRNYFYTCYHIQTYFSNKKWKLTHPESHPRSPLNRPANIINHILIRRVVTCQRIDHIISGKSAQKRLLFLYAEQILIDPVYSRVSG